MFEFLEKLRARPLYQRKQIALFSTGGIFAAIFMVWWITFTSPVNSDSVAVSEVASPLTVVANVAYSARDTMSALPGKLMNQMRYDKATSSNSYQNAVVYSDQLTATTSTP